MIRTLVQKYSMGSIFESQTYSSKKVQPSFRSGSILECKIKKETMQVFKRGKK